MKKIIALVCVMMMLCATAFADKAKEEVVYGMLDSSGGVRGVYVVNIFEDGRSVTDYGDYESVRGMNFSAPIAYENGTVAFDAGEMRAYYEGVPKDAHLPWDVAVRYEIDGEAVAPDALAGRSGHLKITVHVAPNADADPAFFAACALQVSLSLDAAKCANIASEGATMANVGGQKQLTYILLPGAPSEIVVETDAADFAFSGISLNGVYLTIRASLTEDKRALLDGALDGVKKLESGASALATAAKLTDTMAGALETAAANAAKDAASTAQAAQSLSDSSAKAAEDAQKAFDGALDALGKSLGTELTAENYRAKLDGANLSLLTALDEMRASISALGEDSGALLAAARAAEKSTATAAASATGTRAGATLASEGAASLNEGVSQFTQDAGAYLGADAQETVDKLLASFLGGGEVVSFASAKNNDVIASVQFVLKTDAVAAPETEPEPEAEPAPETLWDRIARLFGA